LHNTFQTKQQKLKRIKIMYNRRNYGAMPQTFGGLLEGFFENGMPHFKGEVWHASAAPVNIHETDKGYDLQVVAPGLKKEDFKIKLDQNILTISYEQKQKEQVEENKEQDANAPKVIRNEYKFRSFKRSFTLNEKVNVADINAKYTDGILYVSLPKKEAAEPTTQEINID
jgi:HSP20 family protein